MDQLLLDMRKSYPEMTMIVVSHDLASVARVADHVLVLREGRVIFSGSHAELEASSDDYLRRFMDRKAEETASRVAAAADPEVRAALDAWLEG